MRIAYRLIFVFLLAAIVWKSYGSLESKRLAAASGALVSAPASPRDAPATIDPAAAAGDVGTAAALPRDAPATINLAAASDARFHCDGRTMCSQMRSCEEAKYFLKNCPNTRMDGNHDGIPCQIQWCR